MHKTVNSTSRFALRGQVTPTAHQHLHHSMQAALWWLLPSDGEFRRAPSGIQYHLARQGRRVVLRRGDVTQTLFGSRMNWIYDPALPEPRRATRHSSNIPVLASDNQASAIATSVPSGAPLTPSLPRKCRRRRRRKARRATNENRAPRSAAPATPDERWANRNAGIPGATQLQLEASDPTSMMRTAVYPGPSIHSQSLTQPPISTALRCL